jgi:hypothetical protein
MDDRAIELLFTQNGLFPRLLRNPAHAYYSPILISIIKSLYISLKPEGHGSHVIDLMFFFFGGQSIQALPIKTYDQFIHLRMKTYGMHDFDSCGSSKKMSVTGIQKIRWIPCVSVTIKGEGGRRNSNEKNSKSRSKRFIQRWLFLQHFITLKVCIKQHRPMCF